MNNRSQSRPNISTTPSLQWQYDLTSSLFDATRYSDIATEQASFCAATSIIYNVRNTNLY
jgi:hypothetical protein